MPNQTVTLEKTIAGHKPFKTIEFREPKWDDYTAIGDPYVWARSPKDPEYLEPMPMPARVKEYAERLLVEGGKPGDPLILGQLTLRDSKQVEDAICGFFHAVDPRMTRGSTASGKPSSSTSNGDPEPSETSPSQE